MDACTLVSTLLTVGERYSTGTEDLKRLVGKMFVLSLRYVDRKALWAELFGDEFVHWDLVEQNTQRNNPLGDLTPWLALLSFCNWEALSRHEGEISASHACLASMRKNLRDVSLDPGGPEGWTLACACLLLNMIRGMLSSHSLEMLTCRVFKRDTHQSCMQLLAKQADVSYPPEEMLSTFAFLLGHMKASFLLLLFHTCCQLITQASQVDTETLQQNRILLQSKKEEKRLCLQLKSVASIKGRPRLRDRVKTSLHTEENKMQADLSLSTWESYAGWCYLHTFPPTLSENVKAKLYFLSAQAHWPWQKHLTKVLATASQVTAKVAQYPVTQPDLSVILRVISSLSMDGTPPFPELTDFRVRCLSALPISHIQRMPLSEILRAYVSSYQVCACFYYLCFFS